MANIISIHSFRRGTGKSIVAANVASLLASTGCRIGLVDADLQSPALSTLFGLDEAAITRSLNDYLWGRCDIEQTAHDVTSCLNTPIAGQIFLIPANPDPNEIARMLRKGNDLTLLNDGFQTLIEELRLDALIVDTHAGLHEEALTLMAICDVLVIMLRHDQQDYQGTSVIVGLARRLNVPRVVLIGNEVLLSFDVADVKTQIEQTFNCVVAAVLPHSDELMALASADIFSLRYPHHPVTSAFKQIVVTVA